MSFNFESVQIRGLNGVDFFKDVTVRFGSVPSIWSTPFRSVEKILFLSFKFYATSQPRMPTEFYFSGHVAMGRQVAFY